MGTVKESHESVTTGCYHVNINYAVYIKVCLVMEKLLILALSDIECWLCFTGHPIVNISATDADGMSPNNEIQYSIASGGEDKFLVNPGTGELEVARGASFDRDRKNLYNLIVVARDKGFPQLSSNTNVTINIQDVNNKAPQFTPPADAMSVQENASALTVVGRYSATDEDSNANLVYKILVNKTKGFDESGSELPDSQLVKVGHLDILF